MTAAKNTAAKNAKQCEQISQLIQGLAAADSVTREQARNELIRLNNPEATRALVGELVDPRTHVRWEAAKALVALADPVAAPALLHALEDDDEDVRWVAAEGLVALQHVGLLTVLSGLTRRGRSIEFCKSAHHALHDLKKLGHSDVISTVLNALEKSEPEVSAPVAAYAALKTLKQP